MHRKLFTVVCLLAVAAAATAGDATEETRRTELRGLRERLDQLKVHQRGQLEREIAAYLEEQQAWRGAQGAAWLDKVTLHWRITMVQQSTIDLDLFDRTAVDGDTDLDFEFAVTDNLQGFLYLTANDSVDVDISPPNNMSFIVDPAAGRLASPPSGAGFPSNFNSIEGFPEIATRTLSGFMDGIGINGTQPTNPGAVTVYEAGFRHSIQTGNTRIHYEVGSIDPRRRFAQTRFTNDANTQFLNNLFDDPPSTLWLTDSSGRTSLGIHAWAELSEKITLSLGYFNAPGQFFRNGQFYLQFHYGTELGGHEFNIRVFGFIDEFFADLGGDGTQGGGVAVDGYINRRIGFFARITASEGEVNPVELDASVGLVAKGPFTSRPDDELGLAVGFISLQGSTPYGLFPQDQEVTLELYYSYKVGGGPLEISPNVQVVSDPGGGLGWIDDTLIVLGLRIYLAF